MEVRVLVLVIPIANPVVARVSAIGVRGLVNAIGARVPGIVINVVARVRSMAKNANHVKAVENVIHAMAIVPAIGVRALVNVVDVPCNIISLRFRDVLYNAEMTGCSNCRWDVRMF